MQLHFYYDVACPYAYLASTRVEALAAQRGAELVWRPFLLGGVFKQLEAPQVPADSWAPQRAVLGLHDILRQAERWDVPLDYPPAHPQRTVECMRLIVGAPADKQVTLTKALFHAYWRDRLDVTDRAVVDRIATAHGVDPAVMDDPAVKQDLFDRTDEAAKRGIFGAPAFFVPGEQADAPMWWGNDRMHFVDQALGGPPRQPWHQSVQPKPGGHIRFFHDFSSPFSYLASTQIEALAAAAGATLAWTPILLGALFRTVGTPDVPMFAMNPAKQAYAAKDLADWAAWWGVPFTFPVQFPLRTVAALRVALQAPEATPHLYRAAWADGRDIGDPDVLARVLAEVGLDAPALMAGTQDPAIKDQLKANTAAAVDAGVFGVPSMQITPPDGGAPVLVWGQDRLSLAAAVATGWRPRPLDMG